MPRKMTRPEMLEYKRRWKLVNDRDLKELRSTSVEEKFRQLAVLFAFAKEMGWDKILASEVDEVRARWRKIRDFYGC